MPEETGLLTWKQLLAVCMASRTGSVSEAARRMGTTRQDVYSSVSRARRRVEEAARTLAAYAAAAGPAARAAPGETLEQLLARLLREADRVGVRLPVGRAEALALLRSLLADKARNGVLVEEACIAATPPYMLPLPIPCGLLDRLGEACR